MALIEFPYDIVIPWLLSVAMILYGLLPTHKKYDKLMRLKERNVLNDPLDKLEENPTVLWALVILTVVVLPFSLEQIGEATGWFHLPVSEWVKGLFK